MDIFFYEAFEEEAAKIKQHLPENIRAGFTWKTIQEYGQEQPPTGLISIRTQSQIPRQWADKLDGILSRSTGYDHLKKYEKQTGAAFPMGYLPLYCHRAVAEEAFLLMLALFRKLPQQIRNFDTFHRDGITGMEVWGKKLLVVGVGNIGSQVVSIGHGMGMDVLPVDIDKKFPDLKYVEIEEGLRNADVIVCAMNLTDENEGYFHYDLLKQAPKGTVFINISRGELSASEDLLKLLEEGHLGALGMDVYEEEKELAVSLRSQTPSNNLKVAALKKLQQKENVIFTPHNAFNTAEGVDRKAEQSVQQAIRFLEKKAFIWNVPYL
ncbi:MAG: hypothetical protein K9J27_05530 [Bacteroidales bacterium]|nr:hypothetical protein [Bacteroidales bacterium]MCF8333380.1 hypothetical protein [Bacteroidales bacterium]